MKKVLIFITFIMLVIYSLSSNTFYRIIFADRIIDGAMLVEEIYSIYDEHNNLLLQRENVLVGDKFLTNNYNKYEVIYVDEQSKNGVAKFIKKVEKPDLNFSYEPKQITAINPTVCLYMTHNDESYLPTDKVDSVYGAGGIHDIAKSIKASFIEQGINAYLDETLHIPHDTSAYSRSSVTAKKLIEEKTPDAIFDIHRDGASRSTYVKKIDGVERCKVRIVVGQASSNYENAEQLALYLLAVGEELYDWLFLDIYYATGHYNQGLHSKSLLFEMGSHMVEKSLVAKSVKPLVEVINTALFNTTVNNETGELTINGVESESTPTINNALNIDNTKKNNNFVTSFYIALASFVSGIVVYVMLTKIIKIKNSTKKSK